MSSSRTGIVTENAYNDPKMWAELYLEFTVGGIGTGVAIADFDRDGRPDIFFVNKTGPNRLYRNLGGWIFEDVTLTAGVAGPLGHWKQGSTFVDIDNDGWLDLYVCRFGAPNLLYLNQRDGTFRESARSVGLDLASASGMAAFCDFDRDGWLDVYIHTNLLDVVRHPNGERDRLYRNREGRGFVDITETAGISGSTQAHSATWWDYNNDAWPDIYVANDFAMPDQLYRNNGDGSFSNVIDGVLPHIPHSSMGADIGDINNDGLIDFFVMDMAASSYEKDQRGMAGERARSLEPEEKSTAVPQLLRNALFLNTGTGVLQEAAILTGIAATDWAWSARFEDLDNDGKLDLHVTNGMIREETNADLLQAMMTAESPDERIRILRNSPVLAEKNFAFRNVGNLAFEDVSSLWGLDQQGVSFGAAFGDLDGDGDLDVVYANFDASATVLRNDSREGNRIVFDLRGTQSNSHGVGATVRLQSARGIQVRQLVLARGYLSSSEPMVHFGLGDETEVERVIIEWPSGIVQELENLTAGRRYIVKEPAVTASAKSGVKRDASLSTDGPFQLVQGAAGLDFLQQEATINETAEQRLLSIRHDRRGPALAVLDLNGDGREDVCISGTTLAPARVALQQTGGEFAAIPLTASPGTTSDGPVLIFDANGDGRNDILQTRGGAILPNDSADYQPALYLGAPTGLVGGSSALSASLHFSVGAATAAGWNRDGTLDVFLGGRLSPGEYPLPAPSALLSNQSGRLVDVTQAVAPELREAGMITSALWTDVDDDGWNDLLLALDWGGIRYFRNDQGRRFEDRSDKAGFASGGSGWWNSLAGADFNGDGRLDYAAGNAGLNIPFTASATRPAVVYYGDFGGDGNPQIVEARYDLDREVPWRSRRELGAIAPALLKKFRRNNAFAQQSLEAIFGADKLAEAQRFVATEFRSGVFLSQPDGTHRFTPFPRAAQIAPIFGMVAGDFDGDGNADLLMVQNSYAPVAVIGRFAGGLGQFMRGDGHGGFTAVPPIASGFVVPGDAKALVVLDDNQDGWPDFLVSRSNATTLFFRNAGTEGGNSFSIGLSGPRGNAHGVGSRITVTLTDGSRQTNEVSAGSSAMSQTSARSFFGYRTGNPPAQVEIRWPDGRSTRHPLDGRPTPARLHFDYPVP
jgi:hypothetical protein